VHFYYPAISATTSALTGGILMTCLALLAAAQVLRGAAPGRRLRRTTTIGSVLPMLFTAQLVLFIGQETVESLIAGCVPSPVEMLLWGIVGQLPAAIVAAALVSWLSARMEAAWDVIVSASAELVADHLTGVRETCPAPASPVSPALTSTFPGAFRKRGPPTLLPSPVL
jgi:hypothetical protein